MLNLKDLEAKLDQALSNETPESMLSWLTQQRQNKKKIFGSNLIDQFGDIQSNISNFLTNRIRTEIFVEFDEDSLQNNRQKEYFDEIQDISTYNTIPKIHENPYFIYGNLKSQQNVRRTNQFLNISELEVF